VQPEAIGRMITVTASLDRVVARCADRVIADHERLWGTAGLVSDPDHVRAASILRQQYLHRRTGTNDHVEVEVQVADLGAYDAVFGTGELPDGHHQTHARVVDGLSLGGAGVMTVQELARGSAGDRTW
jgi:Mu transposase, C-terminal domain